MLVTELQFWHTEMEESVKTNRRACPFAETCFLSPFALTLQNHSLMRLCSKEMDVLAVIFKASVTEEPCWGCMKIMGPTFYQTNTGKIYNAAWIGKSSKQSKRGKITCFEVYLVWKTGLQWVVVLFTISLNCLIILQNCYVSPRICRIVLTL